MKNEELKIKNAKRNDNKERILNKRNECTSQDSTRIKVD
jgi:hypothetical protein